MSRVHKTAHGTELPILNLRGKDYLEVKYRLVWFREDHPNWSIETDFVSITDKSACARATVKDHEGRVIATSHKFENERGFPDFLEKAETGAIGRALALIGYGTQFCADELDEGQRIVDAPVARSEARIPRPLAAASSAVEMPAATLASEGGAEGESATGVFPGLTLADPGEFEIQFGKKYRGKKLREVPREEIESYLTWLEDSASKKNLSVPYDVKVLRKAIELFYAA